jgi:hypothetical protein
MAKRTSRIWQRLLHILSGLLERRDVAIYHGLGPCLAGGKPQIRSVMYTTASIGANHCQLLTWVEVVVVRQTFVVHIPELNYKCIDRDSRYHGASDSLRDRLCEDSEFLP